MAPYGSDPATQRVIFTSVTKDPSDHQVKIDWQKSGGGTLDNGQTVSIVDGLAASAIVGNNPAPEQVATFSGNVNITNLLVPGSSTGMADGENMIVTEVFYQYKPLVAPLLKSVGITVTPTTLVRRTFMRPREGDLNVTSCPAGTANWPPGCSGSYGTMNSGDTTNVPNTATGYTGSETATCSGATVTFSNPTCTATNSDGTCGPANNGTFGDANAVNTAGLCGSGTASPSSVTGSGPWSWACNGSGSGSSAHCQTACPSGQPYMWAYDTFDDMACNAPVNPGNNPCSGSCDPGNPLCQWNASCSRRYDYTCKCQSSSSTVGACGPAGTGTTTYSNASAVNAAGLCSAGTPSPSAVSGNGPWNWSCAGSGGPPEAVTAQCTASMVTTCAAACPGDGAGPGEQPDVHTV